MGKVNNPVNLLRNELAARDAEIEKRAAHETQLEELAETQANLISINARREALLLSCITNALAALERDATGSARFHLLAANAHPRLIELAADMETLQAWLERAGVAGVDLFIPQVEERVEETVTA